ncbi:MAG TPA: VOC family protein, partial [Patescibacteria group bacterium]|nr:VOC family protein [Patescibacteria group bacterium]
MDQPEVRPAEAVGRRPAAHGRLPEARARRLIWAGDAVLTRIAHVAYLVRDYDEAIRWFVDVLGFELIEDSPRGPGKR